jgi:hypothetical protein
MVEYELARGFGMHFRDYSTVQIVQHCLQQGREGEYWDFKQEWHKEIQDLLKDIICFANTVHDKKCYIIFGISDDLKIVGMTEPRRKQADIIDALSNLWFAGDVSPKISVETVMINGVILDVLVVDNIERTPVYLNRDYGAMKRGCIYARVQDRNTPNNGNADMETIENLWKKRMGLTKPPYEYIIDRLRNREEWSDYDGDFYNIYKPEYRIHNYQDDEQDTLAAEFYAYTQVNTSVFYSCIDIIANNTVLDTYQIVHLDGGKLHIPVPEWGFIDKKEGYNSHYSYKFYLSDSPRYELLKFMYSSEHPEQQIAYNYFAQVVLLFDSKAEQNEFKKYVSSHLNKLENFISVDAKVYNTSDLRGAEKRVVRERLKTGAALNKMLLQWRKLNATSRRSD